MRTATHSDISRYTPAGKVKIRLFPPKGSRDLAKKSHPPQFSYKSNDLLFMVHQNPYNNIIIVYLLLLSQCGTVVAKLCTMVTFFFCICNLTCNCYQNATVTYCVFTAWSQSQLRTRHTSVSLQLFFLVHHWPTCTNLKYTHYNFTLSELKCLCKTKCQASTNEYNYSQLTLCISAFLARLIISHKKYIN